MKKLALFVLFVCIGAQAAPLTCSAAPGEKLCALADDANKAFDWWCRGDACGPTWTRQIVTLTRLHGALEGAQAEVNGVDFAMGIKISAVRDAAKRTHWTYVLSDGFQSGPANAFMKARTEFEEFTENIPRH